MSEPNQNEPKTIRCNHCGKMVEYHYDPINHRKNLILTIISVGLWLPIWLSLIFSRTKVCNVCNNPIWDLK